MKIEWKSLLRIGVGIFLLYICITYWSSLAGFIGEVLGAAMPLFIGCAAAYIINILMSSYERHYFPKAKKRGLIRSRRPVCMLAAYITLAAIVVLLGSFVVPELVASAELLIEQIPGAINSLLSWLENSDFITEDLIESVRSIDWQSKLEQIISVLANGVGDVVGTAVSIVSSVFSGVVTAFLAVIFSVYLLAGKEKLGGQINRIMNRYIKESICEKIKYVLSVLNDCFHKYIVGQCMEAAILGVLCTLGMLILRIPYATMTGAVIAFTALIPIVGAWIGAIVGVFMIMTVSPMKAIIFLVFLILLQQVEGNLIYPRVVGTSIGLPAIWVLAAITIGGGVMGIPGMLIGVPIATAIYRLLRNDVNKAPRQDVARS